MKVQSFTPGQNSTTVKFDPDWLSSGTAFNISWETFQNILRGEELHPAQKLKPGEYVRCTIVTRHGIQVYIGGKKLPVHP